MRLAVYLASALSPALAARAPRPLSVFLGLPWPDHPKVKELQAACPPASGLPD